MRQKGQNPSPMTDGTCESLLGCSADQAGDWIAGVAERTAADESMPRHVRLRDFYPIRRRLVAELHDAAQGEPR
jgi:hypothetical protein